MNMRIDLNDTTFREFIIRYSQGMTVSEFVFRWLVGNWLYDPATADCRHFVRTCDGLATCEAATAAASGNNWLQKGAEVQKQCVGCQFRLMDITRAGRVLGFGDQYFRPPVNRTEKNTISWSQNYLFDETGNGGIRLKKTIYVVCRVFPKN